jgi:predicted amidohydrolase YtcJ
MDPRHESITAFSVWQDRIVEVGSDEAILASRGATTVVWDVEGRTIVPGFNDSHLHPRPEFPEHSIHAEVDLRPERVPDRAALVAALRAKADRVPPGIWIRGSNYEDTKLGGHPTRTLLDSISTNHPILLRHSSGHLWVVNGVVLTTARIGALTPDPPGGSFGREPDGQPNGLLREPPALNLVLAAGPKIPEATESELLEGYARCLDRFAAAGLTSITDAAGTPDRLRIYQTLARSGRRPRINVLMQDAYLDRVIAAGLTSGFGNEWVRLAGIKIIHGNSLSGRTCWLSEPYDRVNPVTGKRDDYGIPPSRSQDELNELIAKVHRAGLQPAVHANGDREIGMVLDAFERAIRGTPESKPRMRIEHASVLPDALLHRAKELGVVLALHSYIHEHGDKMEEYGAWRWDIMHRNRSAADLGIEVAANSDWPVSAALPLLRLRSLVTRASAAGKVYGASQRVDVQTALRGWTMGGAWASFEEATKGSITPGKWADFVVLAEDPRQVDAMRLDTIKIVATVIGGVKVYPARVR